MLLRPLPALPLTELHVLDGGPEGNHAGRCLHQVRFTHMCP